ncbi:hypothetical protein SUGI_0728350 [Cryptomeria japonica]|uniref:putative B3 domain-containing protein Os03g0621600 n=1 Tax=Cryptomeria japonica TaxID=3369 RepID=UPI002414A7F3|nr:putative B3 domain-containing protein Os03g0621600 [Cryptomeria japonica]GLJ36278.1 hypothetical protein SUGI_0728350 [Cryptomeria japonica]
MNECCERLNGYLQPHSAVFSPHRIEFTMENENVEEKAVYFFKVMLGDFAYKLRIPPAFVKNLITQIGKNIILQGPNGQGWFVTLWGTSTQLEFRQGWEKFVYDHTIELGDFLVFKYICRSYFRVIIFGRSGCEKNGSVFHSPLPTVWDYVGGKNDHAEAMAEQGKKANSSARACGRLSKSSAYRQWKSSPAGKKSQTAKSVGIETKEKSYQGSYYVSCRRHVSEAERNKALKAANSFTSDKPFSLIIMKPSQVYQGFWLGISKACRANLQLPTTKKIEVTLVDPNHKEWSVQYLGNDNPGMSGGWKSFSLANNLEEGDICVFERVDNNINKFKLAVHIFRVVNTCTPYKRMEGTGKPGNIALSSSPAKKKMKGNTVSRKDLAINLSGKAFIPKQGKIAERGFEQVQVKKELGASNSIKPKKCMSAIYDKKPGSRRCARFNRANSLAEFPKKEICSEAYRDGQKSISGDEVELPRKIISLDDENENVEQDDLIIISD